MCHIKPWLCGSTAPIRWLSVLLKGNNIDWIVPEWTRRSAHGDHCVFVVVPHHRIEQALSLKLRAFSGNMDVFFQIPASQPDVERRDDSGPPIHRAADFPPLPRAGGRVRSTRTALGPPPSIQAQVTVTEGRETAPHDENLLNPATTPFEASAAIQDDPDLEVEPPPQPSVVLPIANPPREMPAGMEEPYVAADEPMEIIMVQSEMEFADSEKEKPKAKRKLDLDEVINFSALLADEAGGREAARAVPDMAEEDIREELTEMLVKIKGLVFKQVENQEKSS